MKYKTYLPSYEECVAICEKYNNFQFYEKIEYVDNYKISVFNYRLVGYNDFLYPLGEDSDVSAMELRGICFVFNLDGSLFKRFLMMNKFFNVNQVAETQFNVLNELPIKNIYNKLDGTCINFVLLPNNKIVAKTKMKFDNEQALLANDILNSNSEIYNMVSWALERDLMPIMEYISPINRIVLKYTNSELVLLKFRNLITGEYHDLSEYPLIHNIKIAEKEDNKTLSEILEYNLVVQDKEGCVIEFENGLHAKSKTKYYNDLHFTLTETINRVDYLIEKVCDETIDDLMAIVDSSDKEIVKLIDDVEDAVCEYLSLATKRTEKIYDDFINKYNSSKKDLVANYGKRDKYLGYVLRHVDNSEDMLDIIKNDLKKNTYHLGKAKDFIINKDF